MSMVNSEPTTFFAGSIESKRLNLVLSAGRVLLILLCLGMAIAVLHPELRASVRSSLLNDYRIVVSTARADLLGDGHDLNVVKVRARDGLFIEIYRPEADGSQTLLERTEIQDARDAYFNFNGQPSNLAIDDIDGDGRREILVPSFDRNLVGHINVYVYDRESGGIRRTLL